MPPCEGIVTGSPTTSSRGGPDHDIAIVGRRPCPAVRATHIGRAAPPLPPQALVERVGPGGQRGQGVVLANQFPDAPHDPRPVALPSTPCRRGDRLHISHAQCRAGTHQRSLDQRTVADQASRTGDPDVGPTEAVVPIVVGEVAVERGVEQRTQVPGQGGRKRIRWAGPELEHRNSLGHDGVVERGATDRPLGYLHLLYS
jgi:hypothetical protein